MAFGSGYVKEDIQASVSIAGLGNVGATNVTVTYGINMLPQATVEIAVGKAVGGGGAVSPGLNSLGGYRKRMSISAKVGDSTASIFNGYITGVSSKKSSGRFTWLIKEVKS